MSNMIYLVLIAHFVADFVLQTDKMATNKSKSNYWLLNHVLVYTLVMSIFGLTFGLINGLSHFAVDFISSRLTSYFWKKGDRHNFFVIIGLDQLAHSLILVYNLKYIAWSI